MIYLLNEITLCFATQWKQQNVAYPGAKAFPKRNENGHFIKAARKRGKPARGGGKETNQLRATIKKHEKEES